MYKVLIVDADPYELNTLSHIINWEACDLEVVGLLSDSLHALQFLEDHPVDILIANIRLPRMDGIELLREIRARNVYARCIFLASREDFEYVQKAIPLGIENFLLQPLDPQIFSDTLHGAVQKLAQTQKCAADSNLCITGMPVFTGRSYPPILINHTFEKHMLNQDYAQCLAYLNNLFADASPAANADLRNHIVELVVYIINILRNCNIEVADIMGDDSDLFQKILRFQNTQDLYAWIKEFLALSVKALESKNMRFSPCISRVVAHIEKNYAQDISLKTMAYEMNINAAYLGQLFKSETGQLFSVYLNRTRIENAKKLLLKTNHTLSEVSQQCGYANISYFYNIFKKFTGQTPSQYRKAKTK